MNGKDGVEEMGQMNTMCFRNQTKQVPNAVEALRTTVLDNFETRLVVAIEQFIGNAAGWRLVGQFQRLGAKPLDVDHRYYLVRQNTSDCCGGLKVFEAGHVLGGCSLLFVQR